MDHLLSHSSQRNSLRSSHVSPNSNTYSDFSFPLSMSQVGTIESHANVAGTDNARQEDRNIKLCAPLPLLSSEELGIPVDQVSESAITTHYTSPLSNSFKKHDISITESAQVTPSTQASDQVNSEFLPCQVERTDISLDSYIATQRNQHIACSSPISGHHKKLSYKARIIHFLKNGEELTVAELSDKIKKADPEITQTKSWIGGIRKALTSRYYPSTNNNLSIFEIVPTFFTSKQQRWRMKEIYREYWASQIEADDRIIKDTRAQPLQHIRPQTASCLPPIPRKNKPSQTAQSSESASTTLGVSPLVSSETALADRAEKHIYKYMIIGILKNKGALPVMEIVKELQKIRPEVTPSLSWRHRIRKILCIATTIFEKVTINNLSMSSWCLKKSVLENMPHPVMIYPDEITSENKNTKPLNFILPHSESEHKPIASTMKPQTAQLSEMEFGNQSTKKRLRNMEQDGATLDNEVEQQAQKRLTQDHNVKLTHESSSATVCLDDGEKLTHQEQEYDQNIDDSYWTTEREEALQSAWDIVRKMEEAESTDKPSDPKSKKTLC